MNSQLLALQDLQEQDSGKGTKEIVKKFHCPVSSCGKAFSSEVSLKLHWKIHSTIKVQDADSSKPTDDLTKDD